MQQAAVLQASMWELIKALLLQVMQSARNTHHRTWSGDTESFVLLDPQSNHLMR